MRRSGWMILVAAALFAGVTGCQPGEERRAIDQGAIPAAPDMRPGTEAAPGGVAAPGVVTDTIPGDPREPLTEGPPSAGTSPD